MCICYLCNTTINKTNESWEHILPNSVGGTLKSKRLICESCNRAAGSLIDKELANFASFYVLKYSISKKRSGNNTLIAKEKGTELSKIFEHEFVLNNELLLRSIAKIFTNFYYHKTKDKKYIQKLIEFITTDIENNFCGYADLSYATKFHKGKPYHILIIKGDKEKKIIYGYLEIFGEKGFIILLNINYTDKDFQYSYTFDPHAIQVIEFNYPFQLSVRDMNSRIQHTKTNLFAL